MEPKLVSYITSKFTSKSDMMYAETLWQEVLEEMLPRFKEAGAMRQVVTQVWNQEGSFILGNLWEYKDEKAFIACQELFREAEAKMDERTDIAKIITPSRGFVRPRSCCSKQSSARSASRRRGPRTARSSSDARRRDRPR